MNIFMYLLGKEVLKILILFTVITLLIKALLVLGVNNWIILGGFILIIALSNIISISVGRK
jgi:hypothetical protein